MSKEINKQQDRLNDTAEKIVELLSLTALEDRGAILALVGKKMDVQYQSFIGGLFRKIAADYEKQLATHTTHKQKGLKMNKEIDKLVKDRHHAIDSMAVEKNRVVSSVVSQLDGILPALTNEQLGYVRQAIHLLNAVNENIPKNLSQQTLIAPAMSIEDGFRVDRINPVKLTKEEATALKEQFSEGTGDDIDEELRGG